ncbi:MAG: hypothetical protein JWL70_3195 [Acidimicrobiia bacterium]|nr:hypothetical protein [Acidimicrobiia bacterium]
MHERRIPSFGAIVEPREAVSRWAESTQLAISHQPLDRAWLTGNRRFADGLSSWLVRRREGEELVVFDRPAGSERDLVVLAAGFGATVVQRHPNGSVRIVGSFGVLRWDGLSWHREPPLSAWIDSVGAAPEHGDGRVLESLLEFAVHDLGSRGVGALLVYRPHDAPSPAFERRLPAPPLLRIGRPADLAPLRHALGQLDGAAIFDGAGTLRHLGVRLVPSPEAESDVEGYRGMRHTSGRRYSFDDERATVIVVSDDGPVTVLRAGEVLGSSARGH